MFYLGEDEVLVRREPRVPRQVQAAARAEGAHH